MSERKMSSPVDLQFIAAANRRLMSVRKLSENAEQKQQQQQQPGWTAANKHPLNERDIDIMMQMSPSAQDPVLIESSRCPDTCDSGVASPLDDSVVADRGGTSSGSDEAEPDLASPPRFHDGLLLSTTPFITAFQMNLSPCPRPELLRGGEWTTIAMSEHAQNTINPIRRIVDVMSVKPNPEKSLVKLHLGDPTLTGFLKVPSSVTDALINAVHSGKHNGYGPSIGNLEARAAVARAANTPEAPVTPDDVIMTSGCSHALQMAIEVVGNAGHNILIPRPGFPLYTTLMRPHQIEERYYDLLPEQNWECDLVQMESQIDHNTRAIVVNNPSNPCGAVFSKQHLQDVLTLADKYGLVIIADEVYNGMAYDGAVFHPIATLEPRVPVLTCDSISKKYLVPGWRLGWLIIHDPHGALKHIRTGLRNLSTKIVGPCAIMQGALPDILEKTPPEFYTDTLKVLETNARVAYETLQGIPGVHPVRPKGAMYMMVKLNHRCFPAFRHNEMALIKALISEESVYCLPGTAFHYPGLTFRMVLTYPEDITREACERIKSLCQRHYKPKQ